MIVGVSVSVSVIICFCSSSKLFGIRYVVFEVEWEEGKLDKRFEYCERGKRWNGRGGGISSLDDQEHL